MRSNGAVHVGNDTFLCATRDVTDGLFLFTSAFEADHRLAKMTLNRRAQFLPCSSLPACAAPASDNTSEPARHGHRHSHSHGYSQHQSTNHDPHRDTRPASTGSFYNRAEKKSSPTSATDEDQDVEDSQDTSAHTGECEKDTATCSTTGGEFRQSRSSSRTPDSGDEYSMSGLRSDAEDTEDEAAAAAAAPTTRADRPPAGLLRSPPHRPVLLHPSSVSGGLQPFSTSSMPRLPLRHSMHASVHGRYLAALSTTTRRHMIVDLRLGEPAVVWEFGTSAGVRCVCWHPTKEHVLLILLVNDVYTAMDARIGAAWATADTAALRPRATNGKDTRHDGARFPQVDLGPVLSRVLSPWRWRQHRSDSTDDATAGGTGKGSTSAPAVIPRSPCSHRPSRARRHAAHTTPALAEEHTMPSGGAVAAKASEVATPPPRARGGSADAATDASGAPTGTATTGERSTWARRTPSLIHMCVLPPTRALPATLLLLTSRGEVVAMPLNDEDGMPVRHSAERVEDGRLPHTKPLAEHTMGTQTISSTTARTTNMNSPLEHTNSSYGYTHRCTTGGRDGTTTQDNPSSWVRAHRPGNGLDACRHVMLELDTAAVAHARDPQPRRPPHSDTNHDACVVDDTARCPPPAAILAHCVFCGNGMAGYAEHPRALHAVCLDDDTGMHAVVVVYSSGVLRGWLVTESELVTPGRADHGACCQRRRYTGRANGGGHSRRRGDDDTPRTSEQLSVNSRWERCFTIHLGAATPDTVPTVPTPAHTVHLSSARNILLIRYENEPTRQTGQGRWTAAAARRATANASHGGGSAAYLVALPIWDSHRGGWSCWAPDVPDAAERAREAVAMPLLGCGAAMVAPIALRLPLDVCGASVALGCREVVVMPELFDLPAVNVSTRVSRDVADAYSTSTALALTSACAREDDGSSMATHSVAHAEAGAWTDCDRTRTVSMRVHALLRSALLARGDGWCCVMPTRRSSTKKYGGGAGLHTDASLNRAMSNTLHGREANSVVAAALRQSRKDVPVEEEDEGAAATTVMSDGTKNAHSDDAAAAVSSFCGVRTKQPIAARSLASATSATLPGSDAKHPPVPSVQHTHALTTIPASCGTMATAGEEKSVCEAVIHHMSLCHRLYLCGHPREVVDRCTAELAGRVEAMLQTIQQREMHVESEQTRLRLRVAALQHRLTQVQQRAGVWRAVWLNEHAWRVGVKGLLRSNEQLGEIHEHLTRYEDKLGLSVKTSPTL